MLIKILGTGTSQGVPMIGCFCQVCTSENPKDNRLRCSVYIEHQNRSILIDTSADFRQQMLNFSIPKIDAVLYTHEHRDHLSGLDDLRAYNYWQKSSIPIYAEKRVLDRIKMEFDYVFTIPRTPGTPELTLYEITDEAFEVANIAILPIRGIHLQLPVLGFRIGSFAYLTDMNAIDIESLARLQGLDYLIINALQQKPHPSHFSLSEALHIIEKIKPKKSFLTHIGHHMGLHQEVDMQLPENVHLAYDGLTFVL